MTAHAQRTIDLHRDALLSWEARAKLQRHLLPEWITNGFEMSPGFKKSGPNRSRVRARSQAKGYRCDHCCSTGVVVRCTEPDVHTLLQGAPLPKTAHYQEVPCPACPQGLLHALHDAGIHDVMVVADNFRGMAIHFRMYGMRRGQSVNVNVDLTHEFLTKIEVPLHEVLLTEWHRAMRHRENPSEITGEVIGFRNFKVFGGILWPQFVRHVAWVPGTNEAVCRATSVETTWDKHPAPQLGCRCGLNAYYDRSGAASGLIHDKIWDDGTVPGAVVGWGNLILQSDGWRASHARVVALVGVESSIAANYRADLVEPDMLEPVTREHAQAVPVELRPPRLDWREYVSYETLQRTAAQFAEGPPFPPF